MDGGFRIGCDPSGLDRRLPANVRQRAVVTHYRNYSCNYGQEENSLISIQGVKTFDKSKLVHGFLEGRARAKAQAEAQARARARQGIWPLAWRRP